MTCLAAAYTEIRQADTRPDMVYSNLSMDDIPSGHSEMSLRVTALRPAPAARAWPVPPHPLASADIPPPLRAPVTIPDLRLWCHDTEHPDAAYLYVYRLPSPHERQLCQGWRHWLLRTPSIYKGFGTH